MPAFAAATVPSSTLQLTRAVLMGRRRVWDACPLGAPYGETGGSGVQQLPIWSCAVSPIASPYRIASPGRG